MDSSWTLCQAFLGRATQAHRIAASDPLEATLRARWEEARAAWPGIVLEAEVFAGHLGTCLPEDSDPDRFLASARVGELYLTCACARGVPAALAAFERDFLRKVPGMLSRIDTSPAFVDEVKQVLRERLLISPAGGEARIAQFSGQGALFGWLRISAVRTAQNLIRAKHEHPVANLEAMVDDVAHAGLDPEREMDKANHQPGFKEALRAAFAGLPEEQRNILHWHYLDGLSGEAIAQRLGVVRRTVVRRLNEAREALSRDTTRNMKQRVQMDDKDFDSFMGVVRSGLNLSTSIFNEKKKKDD